MTASLNLTPGPISTSELVKIMGSVAMAEARQQGQEAQLIGVQERNQVKLNDLISHEAHVLGESLKVLDTLNIISGVLSIFAIGLGAAVAAPVVAGTEMMGSAMLEAATEGVDSAVEASSSAIGGSQGTMEYKKGQNQAALTVTQGQSKAVSQMQSSTASTISTIMQEMNNQSSMVAQTIANIRDADNAHYNN